MFSLRGSVCYRAAPGPQSSNTVSTGQDTASVKVCPQEAAQLVSSIRSLEVFRVLGLSGGQVASARNLLSDFQRREEMRLMFCIFNSPGGKVMTECFLHPLRQAGIMCLCMALVVRSHKQDTSKPLFLFPAAGSFCLPEHPGLSCRLSLLFFIC